MFNYYEILVSKEKKNQLHSLLLLFNKLANCYWFLSLASSVHCRVGCCFLIFLLLLLLLCIPLSPCKGTVCKDRRLREGKEGMSKRGWDWENGKRIDVLTPAHLKALRAERYPSSCVEQVCAWNCNVFSCLAVII